MGIWNGELGTGKTFLTDYRAAGGKRWESDSGHLLNFTVMEVAHATSPSFKNLDVRILSLYLSCSAVRARHGW